jgi:hypothetical protein
MENSFGVTIGFATATSIDPPPYAENTSLV